MTATATRSVVACETIAEYEDGARAIATEQIGDRLQVSDISLDGDDSYVIARDIHPDELDALVADYLDKAERIGCCPLILGR